MSSLNINKNTIFYFSGTGNSLQVSKDIAERVGGIELQAISEMMKHERIKIQAETIGIVFPVYMLGMPLIVEEFVKKLEIGKDTYVFSAATLGGMAGKSLEELDKLLKGKGSKVDAGFLIKMPGNYIVLYGAISEKEQAKILDKEEELVEKIARIVKAKEAYGFEKSSLKFDRVISSLMHKRIYKVKSMDKKFRTKDNCISCGLCAKICPVDNIEMKAEKPCWKSSCEQCMACIQYCPKEAIEHDERTVGRKRYRNPNVEVSELLVK